MKRLLLSALAAASVGVLAAPAMAQPYHRPLPPPPVWGASVAVDAREASIADRINEGSRDGTLSRDETYRLRTRLDDIKRLEARYRAGGISAYERNDLINRLQDLSRMVYNQRHDAQERAWRR